MSSLVDKLFGRKEIEKPKPKKVSISLSADDTMQQRCDNIWSYMGFVNDRLCQKRLMAEALEFYQFADVSEIQSLRKQLEAKDEHIEKMRLVKGTPHD